MKDIIYRWRLWKICRKLHLHPMTWQRDFILGKETSFYGDQLGRRTGKTISVILYGLVRGMRTEREIIKLAGKDPDCIFPTYHERLEIFIQEYKKVAKDAGIEVS